MPGKQKNAAVVAYFFAFVLLQKIISVTNRSLWQLNVLFIIIILTNENNFHEFWSLDTIARK